MVLLKKCKFYLDASYVNIDMPYTIDKVRRIKVRSLSYTSQSVGNRDLTIKIKSLSQYQQGMFFHKNRSNDRYFFTMPLNRSVEVEKTFLNFTSEMDLDLPHPLPPINYLEFEVLINDVPTNDVTEQNPVVLELAFYD